MFEDTWRHIILHQYYFPWSNIAYMSGWEQVHSVLLLTDDKTPQQKLVSSSRKCLGCKQNVNRAGAELRGKIFILDSNQA